MTPLGRIGILLALLAVLAVVLVRLWMVSATSAASFENRFNASLGDATPGATPGLYRLEVGRTRLGLTGGSLIAEEVRLTPDSAALARLDSAGTPARTQYFLTIPRIELRGIDRLAWSRGQVAAREVIVRAPEFDVRFDRRLGDPSPGAAVPPPHELLREIAGDLTMGRFVSRGGSIRYHERARDGARFALLHFHEVEIDATGITTMPVETEANAIVPIHLAALLGGRARISAQIDYDLRASDVTLSMTGGLGPTDGLIFNEVLVDLEGIRITGAAVDTIHFEIEVEEGAARGRMLALYRDLNIERLDKVTLTQSLGDQIASFLGNAFKLTPSNPRFVGDPPQTVALAHRRPPGEPFFKFLWVTLRGGLLETVGLQ